MLKDKSIIVGVTGGIAAYKVVDLVSRLKKRGAEVFVVMTKGAQEFVTPLTFQTISQNPVSTNMFSQPNAWEVEHISLADRADTIVIAPATANIIGKIAGGIADDMLTTVVLASKAPIIFAPSMNVNMFENTLTQRNIETLKKIGHHIIEPEDGFLACGYTGKGRLPQTDIIIDEIEYILTKKDLYKKKVLVTAGPTREDIDPVRYITNHSSGKMGYAIAKAARDRGGDVVLISGATQIRPPLGVKFISIGSALEMKEAVMNEFEDADIVIKAAAVADYRPRNVSEQKVKKSDGDFVLKLTNNPDILSELGKQKGKRILVGFAAETQNIINNAQEKLRRKNLDMIVANDLTLEGSGFNTDTNIVTIISSDGKVEKYNKMDKKELAHIILDKISGLLK